MSPNTIVAYPEGPRVEKIQSREAILKKSSFQYGMKISIENEMFIPGPSLTTEKQGPALKFSIGNESFKLRMKISSENENFVRGGMVFSCVRGPKSPKSGKEGFGVNKLLFPSSPQKGACRRAKRGRFGSLAFAMKNRHFGGESSRILAGKARECGKFWMFACVPNPSKQSIWRQCPQSARETKHKKNCQIVPVLRMYKGRVVSKKSPFDSKAPFSWNTGKWEFFDPETLFSQFWGFWPL